MLKRPKKNKTAVHCCAPVYRFMSSLVSQYDFHVVSALQFIICLHILVFFRLIGSLVDSTLAAFIVSGPLQFLAFPMLKAFLSGHLQHSIFIFGNGTSYV